MNHYKHLHGRGYKHQRVSSRASATAAARPAGASAGVAPGVEQPPNVAQWLAVLREGAPAAKKALLFSNPDLTMDKPCPKNCTQHWYTCCCNTKLGKECVSQRKFLSIFASTNNGKSWPFKKLVWPCVSVYAY